VTEALPSGPWVEASLDDARVRLERALASSVAFDADLPGPERELLAALATIDQAPVSFSTSDPREQQATRVLDSLLERVGASARIETRADGGLLASTIIGLAGDFTTTIAPSASPSDLELHAKSIDQILRTRQTWLRMLLSTLQVAAKITAATGTGQWLVAIHAAWRFLRGVMAEWEARTT
jgi:hypothetical protein